MTRTRLYLNLRGTNLVLDFSDNGGLRLLSQYFKNVISHSVVAALGPHFHFEQCPADGGVCWVRGSAERQKEGEDTVAVFVI